MDHSESNGHSNGYQHTPGGPFIKGNPGKPNGATVASTKKIKDAIHKFLEFNIEEVQASFDKLKPVEKLQFITAILPYAVPKLQSVNADTGQAKQIIEVIWDQTLLPTKSSTDLPPQE